MAELQKLPESAVMVAPKSEDAPTVYPYMRSVDTTIRALITEKADLASPTFTGDPKAPTASPGDNDTSIATTAFVTAAIAAVPPSAVLQVLQNTYTASTNLSTVIPLDDTTPDISEGTEVLSQAITPADNTNKVLCLVNCWGAVSAANSALIVALFRGSTCINVASHTTTTTNFPSVVCFAFLDSPASASAQTYSVRVGPNGAATHVRLNGSSAARQYGGAASSTLTVMEISAT